MMPLLKYSPAIARGIPQFQPGSDDFERYWRQEIDYCINGYKPPDGVWIPGSYYRHLNHRPIKRRRYAFDPGYIPGKKNKKILTYPLYRDIDHELHEKIFRLREEQKRIGIMILKGRRKGASDDITSITETELLFNTAASCFYCTPDARAMAKIKQKFKISMENTNPQLAQPFRVKNFDQRETGMEVDTDFGTKRILGSESILYTSQIPDSAIWKGEQYDLGVTDEIGTFKRVPLKQYWGDTKDCFVEGDELVGFHIALGTVDQEGFKMNVDVETFWRNAAAFNWETHLIAADRQYGDHWDVSTGISNRESARKAIYAIRAPLEAMDDKTAYNKEVQNNPLDESELFLLSANDKIDTVAIQKQLARITLNPDLAAIEKYGVLEWERKTEGRQNLYTGRVFFIERAGGLWCKTYDPINHIYPDADITAVDDYFKDEAPESDSEGGIVVWRRFINNNQIARIPILTYLGRPAKLDHFHDEALKAAVYTKSRAAVEFHNKMMKEWFLKSTKVVGRDYLKVFPRVNGKMVAESDAYGYNIKDQKDLIAERLNAWSQSPHLENTFDTRFLKNISIFGKENSDLGSAAGVALCYEEDMAAVPVKKEEELLEDRQRLVGLNYEMRRDGIPIQLSKNLRENNHGLFKKMRWMEKINQRS